MPTTATWGRLLPSFTSDGRTQMVLDRLLLEQPIHTPVLRFYRWDGPWLSLGRHQRDWPEHWTELARSNQIGLVRRPSGGKAVLHAGGLTYALIWPSAPRRRREAYRQACQWLIHGFAALGMPLHFGDEPAGLSEANCFSRCTAADLVDRQGIKRVGSAQRWLHGRLLQHGEILLDPPQDLWQTLFGSTAPPPTELDPKKLETTLVEAFKGSWPDLSWREQPLDRGELQALEASLAEELELTSMEPTI